MKIKFPLAATLIALALLVAFFASAMNDSTRFAHRDVAFYYYPLFEYVQKLWESGTPPWWNPHENLGQPLAGDPTASVFYPGKALFFLSSAGVLSFGLCFKLYIWSHVALAWFYARKLSRGLGASSVGSALSGLSYAFSGHVLFQYSNVVYLVGAAWAPALLLYALRFRASRSMRAQLRAVFAFSVVASLAILGGEPQIVYLIVGFSSFVLLFTPRRSGTQESTGRSWRKTLFFLVSSCALTFALAAVQIIPTLEVVERSSRANVAQPRSVWEAPKALRASSPNAERADCYDVMFCQDISQGGPSATLYRFSVGPWRWLEFLFPNIGGRQFPQSERWFDFAPEDVALWTPTLYMGLLPATLAFAAFRWRSRRRARPNVTTAREGYRVIATRLFLFGLLGALGGYGLGWLCRILMELVHGSRPSLAFNDGDPLGGLYWTLNLLAPKFAQFRYPAKLITLVALAISLLAGFGWDEFKNARRFRVIVVSVVAFALAGLVVDVCCGVDALKALAIPSNPLYGPFQPTAAARAIQASFLHVLCVGAISIALIAILRITRRFNRGALTVALLISVAVDLYLANAWTIVVAPNAVFARKSSLLDVHARQPNAPPTRVYRYPVWFPPYFQSESSSRRAEERVLWDVETLFPKYPIQDGIAILDSRGATTEKEFDAYLNDAINRPAIKDELAFLGVERVVGPKFWVDRILDGAPFNPSALDWNVAARDIVGDVSRAAIFHIAESPNASDAGSISDAVEILSYANNEIVYLVSTSQDSTLVCSEQFWQDWKATLFPVSPQEAARLHGAQFQRPELDVSIRELSACGVAKTVRPIFNFCRAIDVPRGLHCVVVSYRPTTIYCGALISILAWLVTPCLFAIALSEKARKSSAENN